jgi:hypothetical protein
VAEYQHFIALQDGGGGSQIGKLPLVSPACVF